MIFTGVGGNPSVGIGGAGLVRIGSRFRLYITGVGVELEPAPLIVKLAVAPTTRVAAITQAVSVAFRVRLFKVLSLQRILGPFLS